MHQVDIPDMPANGDPTEVLDHNICGRGEPGKWIGSLHAAKQARAHLQRRLGRVELNAVGPPIGVLLTAPFL
eukprot:9886388-Prorocentrum_lima.AAC.1